MPLRSSTDWSELTTEPGAELVDSRDAAAKESGDILLASATIYAELGELLANLKPKD